jgi:microcin C transport system ATP-binding protein
MGRDLHDLRRGVPLAIREMQIVFQDPWIAVAALTVEQIIAEGLTVHGTAAGKPSRQMVAEIMGEVGLIQR